MTPFSVQFRKDNNLSWGRCGIFILTLSGTGGGPGRPGSQENRCGSLEVGPKLLKFLDFVPFNLLKVLIIKNFGFFLKILRNWMSKTTSRPQFWVKNKKFLNSTIFNF